MTRPKRHKPRPTWESVVLLLGLLILWWGIWTLLLMVVIPDFLHRITFPDQAGWYGGGWVIVPFYALVSIPVFPMFSRLDDRIEQRRRRDTSGGSSARLHDGGQKPAQ